MCVVIAPDDFMPNGLTHLNLFDDNRPRRNFIQLMKVLDGINQSGLGDICFVGEGKYAVEEEYADA